MADYKEFLQELRRIRKSHGFKQAAFSRFLGKDGHSIYTKKEKGDVPLTVEELMILLDKLGFDLMDIFWRDGRKEWPGLIKAVTDIMGSDDQLAKHALEGTVKACLEKIREKRHAFAMIQKVEQTTKDFSDTKVLEFPTGDPGEE